MAALPHTTTTYHHIPPHTHTHTHTHTHLLLLLFLDSSNTQDPYKYAGAKPTSFEWGSTADVAALNAWMDGIATWSSNKGLPIYYGE